MSSIQIKHVSEDTHEAARRRAAEEGTTVSEYVLRLIEQDLAFPSKGEWWARLAQRETFKVDGAGVIAAVREERERELSER